MSVLAGSFDDIDISGLNGGVNTLITFDGAGAGNEMILHDLVGSSLSGADVVFPVRHLASGRQAALRQRLFGAPDPPLTPPRPLLPGPVPHRTIASAREIRRRCHR